MAARHTHTADASSDHGHRAAIVEFDEPHMNKWPQGNLKNIVMQQFQCSFTTVSHCKSTAPASHSVLMNNALS